MNSAATTAPTRALWSKRALWLARAALSLVFVAAALPKLLAPEAFAADVQNYRVLPDALVGPFAVWLPSSELVVAFALLLPRYRRGAAWLGTLLLGAFAIAMAQSRLRGIDLRCGCFGAALDAKVSWLTVARSAALAALAALVAWAESPARRAKELADAQARAQAPIHS
jgi:putative oxidoreductase